MEHRKPVVATNAPAMMAATNAPVVYEVRCRMCRKLLGRNLAGRIEIVCPKCGVYNNVRA